MSASSSVRILLVEDSEDDAFFFRWTLKKLGLACEVVHVIDGAAAVTYLDGVHGGSVAKPDIVFLDLKLPKFSGFDVLNWILRHPFEPKLNVIMLSGSEHASDLQRAEDLGAAGYCVKPISVEQLRARLAPPNSGSSPGSEVMKLQCSV